MGVCYGKLHLLECLWKVVCSLKAVTYGFYKRWTLFTDSEMSPRGPHGCSANKPTPHKRQCLLSAGNTSKANHLPGRLFCKNNKYVGGQREPWFSGKTVRASVIGAILLTGRLLRWEPGARLQPSLCRLLLRWFGLGVIWVELCLPHPPPKTDVGVFTLRTRKWDLIF